LILLADHSYNASTFSARVTASTGATSTARSPPRSRRGRHLHGGAPSKVMTMLERSALPEKAAYVAIARAAREDHGMGHREYKIRDPRAAQPSRWRRTSPRSRTTKWY